MGGFVLQQSGSPPLYAAAKLPILSSFVASICSNGMSIPIFSENIFSNIFKSSPSILSPVNSISVLRPPVILSGATSSFWSGLTASPGNSTPVPVSFLESLSPVSFLDCRYPLRESFFLSPEFVSLVSGPRHKWAGTSRHGNPLWHTHLLSLVSGPRHKWAGTSLHGNPLWQTHLLSAACWNPACWGLTGCPACLIMKGCPACWNPELNPFCPFHVPYLTGGAAGWNASFAVAESPLPPNLFQSLSIREFSNPFK